MAGLPRAAAALAALLLLGGAALAADGAKTGGLKGLAPDLDALEVPQPAPAAAVDPVRQGPQPLISGAIAIGARWLEAEIRQDYVAAADRYKGKVLQVTGTVTQKAMAGDDVELSLAGDATAKDVRSVLCTLRDPASRTAGANSRLHQVVTMAGKATEIIDAAIIARLEDCVVLTGHADQAAAEAQIAERASSAKQAAAPSAAGEAAQPTTEPAAAPAKIKRGIAFYVSADGYLLTNQDAAGDCRTLTAPSEPDAPLVLLKSDPINDLALLRLPGTVPAVARFRAGQDLAVGDAVSFPIVSGEADGVGLTMVEGIVSALTNVKGDTRLIIVNATRQRADSGAPLLDSDGAIAGSVVSAAPAQGTGDTTTTERVVVVQELMQRFLRINGIAYEEAAPTTPGAGDAPAGVPPFAIEIVCQGTK